MFFVSIFVCFHCCCRHYHTTIHRFRTNILSYVTSFSSGIPWVKHTIFMLFVSSSLWSYSSSPDVDRKSRITISRLFMVIVLKLKLNYIRYCEWQKIDCSAKKNLKIKQCFKSDEQSHWVHMRLITFRTCSNLQYFCCLCIEI